jgi:hypothetical protein
MASFVGEEPALRQRISSIAMAVMFLLCSFARSASPAELHVGKAQHRVLAAGKTDSHILPLKAGDFVQVGVEPGSNAQTGMESGGLTQLTVVRAARLLNVVEGQIVTDVNISIKGDRIVSVSTGDVPAGVKVIDLGDMTVLPGLIDV